MNLRERDTCATHRAVLVDLIDRGERSAATSTALDHVSICAVCSRELTDLALIIAALRRMSAEAAGSPVPEMTPADVRRHSLAKRPSRRWSVTSPVLGPALALSLVAVLAFRANPPQPVAGSVVARTPITLDAFDPRVSLAAIDPARSTTAARAPLGLATRNEMVGADLRDRSSSRRQVRV